MRLITIQKLVLITLLTLSATVFADDASKFYATIQAGLSKSISTGDMPIIDQVGLPGNVKSNDLGSGGVVGIGIGRNFNDNIRGEMSLNYRDGHQLDTTDTIYLIGDTKYSYKADLKSVSMFLSGYYDFNSINLSGKSFTPYIGGGIGLARNDIGDINVRVGDLAATSINGKNVTEFAWKLGAGANLNLTEKCSLDLNYQFVDLGKFKSGSLVSNTMTDMQKPFEGNYRTNELTIGLRYKF
jgi:opacity protein-like surface antigen